MRKSLFILAISLLLPLFCYAQESFESIKNKAQNGDAAAQFKLAEAYYDGEGVEEDLTKATYWAKKAAEQGNTWGQMLLEIIEEGGDKTE